MSTAMELTERVQAREDTEEAARGGCCFFCYAGKCQKDDPEGLRARTERILAQGRV